MTENDVTQLPLTTAARCWRRKGMEDLTVEQLDPLLRRNCSIEIEQLTILQPSVSVDDEQAFYTSMVSVFPSLNTLFITQKGTLSPVTFCHPTIPN